MDMLTVGNEVTIKVRNALYDVRDRYANGYVGPEFNNYTGTIVREKFFSSDEVGITTGDPRFPVRRIHRARIVEVGGAKLDYTPVKSDRITKTVQGSKGNTYIVTAENGKATCTCQGYSFRKTCKHTQEVLA
jgi:hypothetical protein